MVQSESVRLRTRNLSDTSALVLLLTDGAVHTSKHSKKYLGMLNLDSGRALYSECDRIWPHYGEVIKNRKRCIMDLVLHHVIGERITQLAVLGSGMDALSLETVSRARNVDAYDVDYSHMGLKERLIRKAYGPSPIRCVLSDLNDSKKVLDCMRKNGWGSSRPSVLVLEGISYYLSRKKLWDLVAAFKTADRRNVLILEYMVPQEGIAKKRQQISEQVFGAIQKKSGNPKTHHTVRYDADDVRMHVKKIGGCVIRRYRMKDMEKSRTGHNVHFKTYKSGWIEICQAVI